jgi:hypothetical protein
MASQKPGKMIYMYNSMGKSDLTYGAEILSLYEDGRRRIDLTEMDSLRGQQGFLNYVQKTNEYIREKMDTILDDVARKQLIWYGHVERMDPMRLPEFMINWKPEGS